MTRTRVVLAMLYALGVAPTNAVSQAKEASCSAESPMSFRRPWSESPAAAQQRLVTKP
jgi:hypothetical protein